MKKAVIFDLDGTLINSLPDIANAMNRSLAKHGLPTYAEKAYNYMVGDGVIHLAKRAVGPRQDCFQAVLDAYKADYGMHCRVDTHPYQGIPQALEALSQAGIKICVFSNKDMADTKNVVAHYFPGVSFSAVRGREDSLPIKPDPAGALLIAKELGLSPDECWYVGDTNTDMLCGQAAGMETIGVLWGFREKEELLSCGAKHLADTPEALLQLILS